MVDVGKMIRGWLDAHQKEIVWLVIGFMAGAAISGLVTAEFLK